MLVDAGRDEIDCRGSETAVRRFVGRGEGAVSQQSDACRPIRRGTGDAFNGAKYIFIPFPTAK
jgi:hypothetical protein